MKFISKYSNDKEVTAAQFITEMICEKKAEMDKEDLHFRFWLAKKWVMFFRNQIATANQLVKEYDPVAIVRALKNKKANKIYSLRAPFLKPIIEEELENIEKENKELKIVLNRNKEATHREYNNKQNSILSKLKEIEDES